MPQPESLDELIVRVIKHCDEHAEKGHELAPFSIAGMYRLAIAARAAKPFVEYADSGVFDKLSDEFQMTPGSRFARKQLTVKDFKELRDAHR